MYRVITDPIEALKEDGMLIELFKDPTEEMQIAAVKQRQDVIAYIDDPSEKVQLEAVRNEGETRN